MIIEIADDALSNTSWYKADKPWQFLQFCYEYNRFLKEGIDKFETGFIYTTDGSNNGLQHYAAILKDKSTAVMTNVYNNEERKDSYQVVADLVIDKFMNIDSIYSNDDTSEVLKLKELARVLFKFGIDRSLTKRPAMTLAYGSTMQGWRNQTKKFIKEAIAKDKSKDVFKDNDTLKKCLSFYLKHLRQVLEVVFPAPFSAMKYLQNTLLDIINESDKTYFIYENPTGFPFYQERLNYKTVRNRYRIFNTQYSYYTFVDVDEVNNSSFKNSIAPNFIHSIDSAHMDATVLSMKKIGCDFFSMVHDSFGTTLDYADQLETTLRDEFVKLHQNNLINHLVVKVAEFLDVDLNTMENFNGFLEDKNEFDINVVRDSHFFFA